MVSVHVQARRAKNEDTSRAASGRPVSYSAILFASAVWPVTDGVIPSTSGERRRARSVSNA